MSGLQLRITRGNAVDVGRVIPLVVGRCLLVGRSPDTRHTGMLPQLSAWNLEHEDHGIVAAHLRTRVEQHGARAVLASFERDDDVGLSDDAVSARHAMLFCDEAGITMLDLGSTNGTWVNGDRTMSAELEAKDLLRVGETRFEVEVAP